jgi:hypothetical protein
MSWIKYHSKSEKYASQAALAARKNNIEQAADLYRKAAQLETDALNSLEPNKIRTIGITAVSAASLWFKANELNRAQEIAFKNLALGNLPPFAYDQLKNILQTIWNDQTIIESGLEFSKGEVLISVSGGEIVSGGAPLELIVDKVDQVGKLFYRTIEMLLNRPLRIRGGPSPEIKDQFRPWLFQTVSGSYQFTVRVQKPKQLSLLDDMTTQVDDITRTFLNVVRLSVEDPEVGLKNIVPDEGYRETFLKLTRNLAPSGKVFEHMELKSPALKEIPSIHLKPISRDLINETLRKPKDESGKTEENEIKQLRGILRALHLDHDWLEIDVTEGEKNLRIDKAGDVIDDIIGPMVNHPVIIEVIQQLDGKYFFVDIQLDD